MQQLIKRVESGGSDGEVNTQEVLHRREAGYPGDPGSVDRLATKERAGSDDQMQFRVVPQYLDRRPYSVLSFGITASSCSQPDGPPVGGNAQPRTSLISRPQFFSRSEHDRTNV